MSNQPDIIGFGVLTGDPDIFIMSNLLLTSFKGVPGGVARGPNTPLWLADVLNIALRLAEVLNKEF